MIIIARIIGQSLQNYRSESLKTQTDSNRFASFYRSGDITDLQSAINWMFNLMENDDFSFNYIRFRKLTAKQFSLQLLTIPSREDIQTIIEKRKIQYVIISGRYKEKRISVNICINDGWIFGPLYAISIAFDVDTDVLSLLEVLHISN